MGPIILLCLAMLAGPEPSVADAERAMERAVRFFRTQVASHGGYLWRYSADLTKREGEGKATPDTVWVQPPGTPAVGMAYLSAYERTRLRYLLDAARRTGECLIQGQLQSGGWAAEIRFDPAERRRWAYRRADGISILRGFDTLRTQPPVALNRRGDEPKPNQRNVSTLDDDMTQSAIRFLVRLDKALGGKDARIREAADSSIEAVIGAQHPNGAWPQGFTGPNRDSRRSVKSASFPATWSRLYKGSQYWDHYTLNDNVMGTVIATLLDVADMRGDRRCLDAARRGGEFLIRAQLPDPQPGWAQQYNADMEPAWARKFEPPAITGGESQQAMRTLIDLAERTRDARFLGPIPKALAYYRKLLLPDGRLARFYEIGTDRPLYFTLRYELTYDDSDMPTHYAFKVNASLDAIQREHDRVASRLEAGHKREADARIEAKPPAPDTVREVIESLDQRGAWVEEGRLRYHGDADDTTRIIDCETFVRNLDVLSRYIAGKRSRP